MGVLGWRGAWGRGLRKEVVWARSVVGSYGVLVFICVLTRSFVVPHLFHAEVDAVVFRALEVGVTVQVLPVAVTVRLVEL